LDNFEQRQDVSEHFVLPYHYLPKKTAH